MNRPTLPLNDDQRAIILAVDPDFFLDDRERQLRAANQRVAEYCAFYISNQRQPRYNSRDDERRLGQWRINKQKAARGEGHQIPLNDEQRATILDVDPDFFQDIDAAKNKRIEEYIDFYRENNRQPRVNSRDSEEHRLGMWRINEQRANGLGTIHFNDEQRIDILDDDPEVFHEIFIVEDEEIE